MGGPPSFCERPLLPLTSRLPTSTSTPVIVPGCNSETTGLGCRPPSPSLCSPNVIGARRYLRSAAAIPAASHGFFPVAFQDAPRDALYRGHLHVHLRRARRAALASLAADLPSAVLLDININTAVAWSTYAQTD